MRRPACPWTRSIPGAGWRPPSSGLTSAMRPVLWRRWTLQSVTLHGLYPCGEGAGYAGGITSAAVDGLKIAEQIATN